MLQQPPRMLQTLDFLLPITYNNTVALVTSFFFFLLSSEEFVETKLAFCSTSFYEFIKDTCSSQFSESKERKLHLETLGVDLVASLNYIRTLLDEPDRGRMSRRRRRYCHFQRLFSRSWRRRLQQQPQRNALLREEAVWVEHEPLLLLRTVDANVAVAALTTRPEASRRPQMPKPASGTRRKYLEAADPKRSSEPKDSVEAIVVALAVAVTIEPPNSPGAPNAPQD